MTENAGHGPTFAEQGVRGYRDLDPEEVALINAIKSTEENVALMWTAVGENPQADRRWMAVARIHFQEGFSALVRSIGKPYDPFEG